MKAKYNYNIKYVYEPDMRSDRRGTAFKIAGMEEIGFCKTSLRQSAKKRRFIGSLQKGHTLLASGFLPWDSTRCHPYFR